MTATEKYLAMNNEFCKLRDAIYESNVVEADEDPHPQLQDSAQRPDLHPQRCRRRHDGLRR